MSNPLWLGSGGCPILKVSASLYTLNANMCGWSEFGTLSNPPIFYRKYSTAGGWTWTRTLSGHPTWTFQGSGVGVVDNYFDATTGDLTSSGGSPNDVDYVDTNHGNSSSAPADSGLLSGTSVSGILSGDHTTAGGSLPNPSNDFVANSGD